MNEDNGNASGRASFWGDDFAWEVIDALGQGVTVVDVNGRFLYVNPAYARMVGRPADAIKGLSPADLTHPDDRPILSQARRHRHAGETTTYETRLLRPDGTVVYAHITGVPYWQEGKVAGALTIVTDITAHKQAEEAYQTLVENSLQGLLIIQDFRLVFVNNRVEQISGYSPQELKAFSPEQFMARVYEADREAVQRRLAAHLAGEDAPPRMEFRIWHKEGELRWVDAHTKHITYQNKPAAQVAYLDITERKTAEQVLRASEEKLRHSEQRARRQAQELALLNKVRTALARELDLTTIVHTIVEAIANTFGYTLVSLYLLKGETLVLQHQVGYDQVIREIPISKGVNGRVVRTGVPVLLRDVHTDPDFLEAVEDIVSEVCVPLIDRNQVGGTLNVESTQGHILTEDDLQLMVALSKDINIAIHRARLYSEVQQSREQYRLVVNSVGDVIFQTDAAGQWAFLNRAWTEITGFSVAESLGDNLLNYVHPEDREKNTAEFLPLIEKKKEYCRHQVRYLTKAGGYRWIEVHARRIESEAGEILGTSGLLRDVTEPRQRERELESFATVTRALRQANTRTQMLPIILDQTLDLLQAGGAMFVTHPDKNSKQIELARGDWQQLSGQILLAEEGVAGFTADTSDIYINNDIRSSLSEKMALLLLPHHAIMGAPVARTNEVIGVIWVGRPQPFSAIEVQSLKAIVEITATALERARLLKTLEQQVIDRTQELVVAHERLQELNQLKTKFIDDVSHELRTPAASISLYLDLLARGHEDKQEAYLAILQESSWRLNQIITSILQFAHLTETAVAQNPSVIDLNKITADVVSQHRPRAQKNGLNLTFLPGADRISSWGIAGLLSQAIDYLLDNAIKYTVDGSVTIRTYLDEDQQLAYVEIKDTGMGIEPDELEQVFERFYRGQHVSQLTIPGAGLGLSLAQQIVIQSGGKLEIDSEPGLGTTVRLSVPLLAGD